MTDKNITVKRNELKYYINYTDYNVLFNILKEHLAQDENAIRTEGYIRSLYFDNIFDSAFEEKQAGTLNRKKHRLRIYDLSTDKVKFEIKNKFNNQIFKETAFISREDAIKVQSGNYEVLLNYNNPILNKAYGEFKRSPYRPVAIIEYTREAFMFHLNDTRVTFDKHVKATSEKLNIFDQTQLMKPLLKQGILILEVKYNNYLPVWIKKLIQIPRFERSAISKYCIGRLEHYM